MRHVSTCQGKKTRKLCYSCFTLPSALLLDLVCSSSAAPPERSFSENLRIFIVQLVSTLQNIFIRNSDHFTQKRHSRSCFRPQTRATLLRLCPDYRTQQERGPKNGSVERSPKIGTTRSLMTYKDAYIQLDCPSVRHWAYANIFAVDDRFQIRDQFWIRHWELHEACFFRFFVKSKMSSL